LLAGLLVGLAPAASADDGRQLDPAQIDAAVARLIQGAGLEASPICDDATFLRRVTLDLTGTLPTPAAVTAFLADSARDKRERTIDGLLANAAFAARQAELWTDMLLEDFTGAEPQTAFLRQRFRGWLEGDLRAGRGWDAIAADLLAGEGQSDQDPRVIYALDRGRTGPEDMAGSAARQLLGLRIDCARCHDHPFADTTQAEFHTLAAWFARTRVRGVPGKQGVFRVGEAPVGEHRAALLDQSKRAFAPGFLATDAASASDLRPGATPERTTATSRRVAFARWATSPDNPWFARAAVNRVWGRLFGRGLVEPINDLSAAAEAPAAPLLTELGRAFAADGFSLRDLYAALLRTRAYQRAVTRDDDADLSQARERFATASVRPLDLSTRVQILLRVAGRDAASSTEPSFLQRALRQRLTAELRPVSARPPDGERAEASDVTTSQGLVVLNGASASGVAKRVAGLAQEAGSSQRERVEQLYLRVLSRPPTSAERRAAKRHLRQHAGGAGYEDLAWALLASSEFLTNH
jgi:hypothetical protein